MFNHPLGLQLQLAISYLLRLLHHHPYWPSYTTTIVLPSIVLCTATSMSGASSHVWSLTTCLEPHHMSGASPHFVHQLQIIFSLRATNLFLIYSLWCLQEECSDSLANPLVLIIACFNIWSVAHDCTIDSPCWLPCLIQYIGPSAPSLCYCKDQVMIMVTYQVTQKLFFYSNIRYIFFIMTVHH